MIYRFSVYDDSARADLALLPFQNHPVTKLAYAKHGSAACR